MKRFIVAALMLCSSTAFAQMHLKDTKAVSFTMGKTHYGLGAGLGFYKHLSSNDELAFELELNMENMKYNFESGSLKMQEDIKVNTSYFSASFNRVVFRGGRLFGLTLGLAPVIGFESINEGNERLESGQRIVSASRFVAGGKANAMLQLYLSESTAIMLSANQKYMLNSDLGTSRYFLGAGLRYYIY